MSNPYKGSDTTPIIETNQPKPTDIDNEIQEKVIRKLDETFTDTTIQQVGNYALVDEFWRNYSGRSSSSSLAPSSSYLQPLLQPNV